MERTKNYRLLKPAPTDYYDIADFNENMDAIDRELKARTDRDEETRQWTTNTFSNPNLILNGNFQIWQRGTEFETKEFNQYYCDRFKPHNIGSAFKLSKLNESGGMKVQSETWMLQKQPFEQSLIRFLIGKTVKISAQFRVKSKKQLFRIGFLQTGNDQIADGVVYYDDKINATNIIKKTAVFQADYTGIIFGAGVGEFEIDWIKLELGSVATPFVPRPYGEELALCQRFTLMSTWQMYGWITRIERDYLQFHVPVPTTMRVSPSLVGISAISIVNPVGGTGDGFTYSVVNFSQAGYIIQADKVNHGITDAGLILHRPSGFDAEIY